MPRDRTRVGVTSAAVGSVYGVALNEAGFETTLLDASATLAHQTARAGLPIVQVGEARLPCA
jgi:hypothetical protein